MNKLTTFLKDVRLELSRVNWPTKKQTVGYSLAVIATAVIMAVFLGGLDFLFSWILNKFVI